MKNTVKTEAMLNYLQSMLIDWMKELEKVNVDECTVKNKLDGLLACKYMVELLINEPVNLGVDGIVTTEGRI